MNPRVKHENHEYETNLIDLTIKSNELIVNLPLQMSLYFNAYFTPCWLLSQFCSLNQKMERLSQIYQFLAISSLLILLVVEIPRLYLGYFGNLVEKIRELLAFWLLSVLIQFPIHVFRQIDSHLMISPFERLIDVIMLTFLVIQITIGFIAIRNIIKVKIKTR